jgi:hypothetical protein
MVGLLHEDQPITESNKILSYMFIERASGRLCIFILILYVIYSNTGTEMELNTTFYHICRILWIISQAHIANDYSNVNGWWI